MFEGTPEEIEKGNNEWGEYKLLRAKENEIGLDSENDNNQFVFNEANWVEEDRKKIITNNV